MKIFFQILILLSGLGLLSGCGPKVKEEFLLVFTEGTKDVQLTVPHDAEELREMLHQRIQDNWQDGAHSPSDWFQFRVTHAYEKSEWSFGAQTSKSTSSSRHSQTFRLRQTSKGEVLLETNSGGSKVTTIGRASANEWHLIEVLIDQVLKPENLEQMLTARPAAPLSEGFSGDLE